MPLVSKTSPDARAIGCVDVIKKLPDGKLYGDNTAIPAFSYLLELVCPEPFFGKCLILGNGTDANAVKYVLENLPCKPNEIITVTEMGKNNFSNISLRADTELLVNTLPASQTLPFSLDALPALTTVIDLNFSPLSTPLILEARSRGIAAANGIPMVAARIKAANELFFDVQGDNDILTVVEAAIFSSLMTITLLSPDESLAKAVAPALGEAIGKKSFDLGSMFEKLYNKSLSEIKNISGPHSNEFDRMLKVAVEWMKKRGGCVICVPSEIAEKSEYRASVASNGPVIGIVKPEEDSSDIEGFCDLLIEIPSADYAEHAVESIRAELQI
jgi:shikimate dehydrogenase